MNGSSIRSEQSSVSSITRPWTKIGLQNCFALLHSLVVLFFGGAISIHYEYCECIILSYTYSTKSLEKQLDIAVDVERQCADDVLDCRQRVATVARRYYSSYKLTM